MLKNLLVPVMVLVHVKHSSSAEKLKATTDFTEAFSIINYIEPRIAAETAASNLLPFIHTIKRHLVDFARSSEKNKTLLVISSPKDSKPSNRGKIDRKDSKTKEMSTNSFKGHKVIHISNDVEGRLGKWTVLRAMEKLLDSIPSNVTTADRICRPGPIHWTGKSSDTADKKCLIMGDSISLGYMDYVVELLDGDCTVYHAPWSGDGGSLDTRYMLQCLPMFLSSSFYEPVQYDAIIFNAGIHDIDCCDYHNEYVPLKEYKKNLNKIKSALLKTGAMIGFATSTPVPFSKKMDQRLRQYNKAAKKVMKDDKSIKVIDVYHALTEKCGGLTKKCSLFLDQPNVHLSGEGYFLLAEKVSRGFKSLLKRTKKRKKKVSKQNDAPPGSLYCVPKTGKKGKYIHNLTGCPGNTTCCLNGYSNSFVGCCMLKDAMDCGDNWHCCPKGTVCDPGCTGKSCVCRKAPWESKASRTAFSLLMKALNSFWNKIAKNYPSLEKS
ncbi:uncharacterized protein [Pocillopora verrucosa]|uniref:uncharacterized protein n=1 Tax=Pocillopora verrucosa TaxID=203993 RepID=UPI0033413D85